MSFSHCFAVSSILIAIILNIVIVIKSFINKEEKGLYAIKLISSIFLNGLFIWFLIGIIKGGNQ